MEPIGYIDCYLILYKNAFASRIRCDDIMLKIKIKKKLRESYDNFHQVNSLSMEMGQMLFNSHRLRFDKENAYSSIVVEL